MNLDGARLRHWLESQRDTLVQSARERHEADGADDPTALRMDGGVAAMTTILGQLPHFEAGRGPQLPMDEIKVPASHRVQRYGQATSFAAAVSQSGERSRLLYKVIWNLLLREGPKTDDEIFAFFDDRGKKVTQNSLRPRRKELTEAGWIRDSGQKRPSANGRPAIVWEALPSVI